MSHSARRSPSDPIAFDNTHAYTIGGATITLAVLISDRASINVLSGSHTISARWC